MLISRHSFKPAKITPALVSNFGRDWGTFQDIVLTFKGSGPFTYFWSYTSPYGPYNNGSGFVTSSNVFILQNQFMTYGSYVYANHTLTVRNRYGQQSVFYNLYS